MALNSCRNSKKYLGILVNSLSFGIASSMEQHFLPYSKCFHLKWKLLNNWSFVLYTAGFEFEGNTGYCYVRSWTTQNGGTSEFGASAVDELPHDVVVIIISDMPSTLRHSFNFHSVRLFVLQESTSLDSIVYVIQSLHLTVWYTARKRFR